MKPSEIEMLARSGSFRNQKFRARIEETHISWVLFTRQFAFKLKKPVKLPFLDFSTLGRRKNMAQRELILNRRFTDIYLDVLPVTKSGDLIGIAFKKGKIIDYAVRMKRLSTRKRMDNCLKEDRVSIQDIRAIAGRMATFHATAKVIKDPFHLGQAKKLFNEVSIIRPFVMKQLGESYAKIIDDCIAWSNQFLREYQPRLKQRIALDFKRDVHGDLHSGNIFLYRKPVIFDCIEFNDEFRQIDVLYEIAFLAMELEFYGQRRLAKTLVLDYTRQFNCLVSREDHDVLNYFKCLRANVRAKVLVMKMREIKRSEPESVSHLRKYIRLMANYIR